MDYFETQLSNPRTGVEEAVIYPAGDSIVLSVQHMNQYAGTRHSFTETYKSESGARIAYTLLFQESKYWDKPQWKRFTHYWGWKKWLPEYFGHKCRIIALDRMNKALIEFPDGKKHVTIRMGLRKLTWNWMQN